MKSFAISIFGPKGGVGKTILASNLAFALARQSRGKVLLVDFDPHDCGDISILLGIQPQKSFSDFESVLHKITLEDFERQIYRHQNIWVLPAVRQLKQISFLTPQTVERVFSLCRERFQYIILDCGSDIHPINIKAFEISSLILFCTTPEILPLSRSVVSLNEFQSLAFPSDLIQIVVNRYNPKGVISEAIISQKLKRDCLALLPEEGEAIQNSIHQGTPLFLSQPRALYSQVIDELSRAILSDGLLKSISPIKLNAPSNLATKSQSVISQVASKYVQGKKVNEEIDRADDIRMRIHQRLIEVMDFRKLSTDELMKQDEKTLEDLRHRTREAIFGIIDKMPEIRSSEERQNIAKDVLDEALGLGPLEDLLADPQISEILVNRSNQIYVEKKGKLIKTDYRFTGDKQLQGVLSEL